MDPSDLKILIKEGEGTTLEFREAVSSSLGREMVAMANTIHFPTESGSPSTEAKGNPTSTRQVPDKCPTSTRDAGKNQSFPVS